MKLKIPLLVKKTLKALEKQGFEAYVVGGAIRDLLMNKPTYDWDFTTDAKPEEIRKIFPESFYDNKFGTVGITAEELVEQFHPEDDGPLDHKKYNYKKEEIKKTDVFEITTFRKEAEYRDRRRPVKVTWGKSLKEDLQRRDFTVNSMALQLITNLPAGKAGHQSLITKIIDPFDGQKDIKKQLIRTVGKPDKRFSEDALRMMRAIRIASELSFSIEKNTLKAINKYSNLITRISRERIRDELFKILKSPYPAQGIKMLDNAGLLQYIMPELLPMKGVEQAGHHTKDVWNHSLDSLAECPSPDPIVRLATLLHDVGKPKTAKIRDGKVTFYNHEVVSGYMSKKIANRLRFSKKDKEKLWILVRYHMFAYDPKMTDKAIRRFIRRVGRENINDMMLLRIGDRKGGGSKATSWRLREMQERIGKLMYTPMEIKDMKVNGRDVMKILGIKPGPKVGQVLEKLFEEVMEDDTKNNREYLLERIKKLGAK